jgi:3-deoxy-D-manno-octulosonic-acid transferase
MFFIYRILINLTLIVSPIILIFRLLKKKEDPKRFKEKLGFFYKKKKSGNLIWFHGASVGELKSIIPLIEKLERNKKIQQILITSNTLSSSKVLRSLKFKKVIHQFFPIDSNLLISKFLNYWQPSKAIFIDSEFWPNTILQLKKREIPIILINGRITLKTFRRWEKLSFFSKKLFNNFSLSLASNKESFKYLKKLNFKNVKFHGNLKYSESEINDSNFDNKLKKIFEKKKTWCASSTHEPEELFIGDVHINLKKKFKNLLTIIIPRHTERCLEIKKILEKKNLKVHLHDSAIKMKANSDIYLVNAYGITKKFYKMCNNIFLGGSLINHGGQNPLEAARYGCSIISGPNVQNFKEIYSFLKKNKISKFIRNKKALINEIKYLFNNKNKSTNVQNKIKHIGDKILIKTYNEIFIKKVL